VSGRQVPKRLVVQSEVVERRHVDTWFVRPARFSSITPRSVVSLRFEGFIDAFEDVTSGTQCP